MTDPLEPEDAHFWMVKSNNWGRSYRGPFETYEAAASFAKRTGGGTISEFRGRLVRTGSSDVSGWTDEEIEAAPIGQPDRHGGRSAS